MRDLHSGPWGSWRLWLPIGVTAAMGTACRYEVYESARDVPATSSNVDRVCVSYCDRLVECGELRPLEYATCFDVCDDACNEGGWRTTDAARCVASSSCGEVGQCDHAPIDLDVDVTIDREIRIGGGAPEETPTCMPCTESPPPNGEDGGGGGTPAAGGAGGEQAAGGASGGAGGNAAGGRTHAGAGASSGDLDAGAPVLDAGSLPDGQCARNHDCSLGDDCVDGTCRSRCIASCQCASGEVCSDDGYCYDDMPPPPDCVSDCDCPGGQRCEEGVCWE